MSYTRWIHNVSGGQKTYRGVPIADNAFYEIQPGNLTWYQSSDDVIADLGSDDIRMSADGTTDYSTSPAENTAYLLGSAPGPSEVAGVKDPNGMRARLVGIVNTTITAGTTVDLDWQMPQLQWPPGTNRKSYFDGIEYYCDGAIGDYCQFQVVDKDGLAYPAGTVLEEFGTNYYMVPSVLQDIILYKASIITGMYLRLKYTSTGATNVKIIANLFRHLDGNS